MSKLILGQLLVPGVAALPAGPIRNFWHRHLHHSPWHGLTLSDLTFAACVMMLGMMVPISLEKHRESESSHRALCGRVLWRSLALFALGVFYNGGLSRPWPEIRLAGILQRLAVCYFVSGMVYLSLSRGKRYALLTLILLGYWLLLMLVPPPRGAPGDYSHDGNLAAWVDEQWLPGQTYFGRWDPEGILTTLPAIGSCLAGMVWGDLFLSRLRPVEKLAWLAGGGLMAINVGLLWSLVFPINKNLWTSSYALVAAGLSSLVMAACYLVADVWQRSNWCFPLIVVGRNILLAFLLAKLIPMRPLADRFTGGDIAAMLGQYSPLVTGLTEAALLWVILYWLYRHGIVVKI